MLILFLVFLIPSLLVRYTILHHYTSNSYSRAVHWLCRLHGNIQDVAIALILTCITQMSFIYLHPVLHWCFISLCALVQLDIIVDGVIYRITRMRLEVPFFAFCNDIRCFVDSAKDKGIAWLYPLGVFLLLVMTVSFYILQTIVQKNNRDMISWVLMSLLPIMLAIGETTFPKKLCYHFDNIVFSQLIWIINKTCAFFFKKNSLLKIRQLSSKKIFQSQKEHYSLVSVHAPLFKQTEGFFGDKQCDVTVKQGEKPHVIFLFLESFRAKDVGVLGGKHPITPCFDKLSKEGVLFSNFYANSIKTSRVVTSSLFGVPSDINSSEASSRLDMPFISIAQCLAQEGYHNAYLHNGDLQFENQSAFFSRYGYSTLIGKKEILSRFPHAMLTSWGVHDEYLMDYAAEWLECEDQKGAPLFLTMFSISNHHPWIAPPGHPQVNISLDLDARYKRFLHTMQYSDHCLGMFIDRLREKKLSEKVILFIMGDHGYPMGEHDNNFIQQRYLYEENIHVPLLILADGRIQNPCKIDTLASQLDLVPTMIDLLKIKALHHACGTSLLRQSERQVFFHNPYSYQFYGTRLDKYKLIYTKFSKELELYNLEEDPDEKENVAQKYPDMTARYFEDVNNYHLYYKSLYDHKLFASSFKKR